MRISLLSPVRKTAFLSGCIVLSLLGWALCWQSLGEHWAAHSDSVEGYRLAARIQPLNGTYLEALGLSYLHGGDFPQAVTQLEKSVDINPLSSRAWLNLASAYGALGEFPKQREAVLRALRVDPKDTAVGWTAGTFLIQNGDIDGGLELIRDVVNSDPARAVGAIQIAYRSTNGDLSKTIAVIPPTAAARLQLVRWLINHGQAPEADRVWPSVLTGSGKVMARETFFYLDSLLARREVDQARGVWASLGSIDPEVRKRTENNNLVANGDFEDNLLNGGFDWRYTPTVGITVTIDTGTFHGGTRSLAVQFDANNVADVGVYQLVAVEPNTHYVLRGFLHAEELESANGIRLAIADQYTNNVLLLTDEGIGSFPWRESTGEFTTTADTRLLRVGLVRSPQLGRIRGKVWLDDVRIEKR